MREDTDLPLEFKFEKGKTMEAVCDFGAVLPGAVEERKKVTGDILLASQPLVFLALAYPSAGRLEYHSNQRVCHPPGCQTSDGIQLS